MAKQQLRDASAALPVAYVVNPDGLIKSIPHGAGISGGIVEHVAGRSPRVSQEARERGWMLLSDAYRDEQRGADYEKYVKFRELAADGKVNPDSFPDRLLPKIVVERRSKAATRPDKLPDFEVGDEAKSDKKGK